MKDSKLVTAFSCCSWLALKLWPAMEAWAVWDCGRVRLCGRKQVGGDLGSRCFFHAPFFLGLCFLPEPAAATSKVKAVECLIVVVNNVFCDCTLMEVNEKRMDVVSDDVRGLLFVV